MNDTRWCDTCNGGPKDHEPDCPNTWHRQSERAAAYDPHVSLLLSPRDTQFVAAALCVAASLLNPDATEEAHNIDMLEALFVRYYSSAEVNDLLRRSKAIVPPDSPVGFVDAPLPLSTTTLLS